MRKLSLRELNRVSISDFRQQEKAPVVLVLDNVRSALNVGSAFRTSDAFTLEKILLCGITAKPPHREILKTAIGATESMEWAHFSETTEAVKQLKDEGYKIWAVEQAEESVWLQDFKVGPDEKYALVFGNEVAGVSEEVMALADGALEVPQFGTKHSLNISVCVGVVCWELFSQWKYDKR
jgi:tRNA G18 (ribose-2'-O)-methylase SpoU